MASSATHSVLLDRLAALGVPQERVPKPEDDGNLWDYSDIVGQFVRGLVQTRQAPGKGSSDPPPSYRPVFVSVFFLLAHWLQPVLMICSCVCAVLTSSWTLALISVVLMYGTFNDWQVQRSLLGAGLVKPGLYYVETEENVRIAEELKRRGWCEKGRDRFTWWMFNDGALHTLIPFLTYTYEEIEYHRTFIRPLAEEREEYIAVDWSFPEGGYNPAMPVLVCCHGLNGCSKEAYVVDLVKSSTARGWTAAVIIARGHGGAPAVDRIFHAAMTSDIHAALTFIRQAVGSDVPLIGTGFSLGAIMLATYCGEYGDNQLSCVIGLSGCYATVENSNFRHSAHLWQPWLTRQYADERDARASCL